MAIDTQETRASTCGILQPWILAGMRAGSSGTGWRATSAHTYAGFAAYAFAYLSLDVWGTPRLTLTPPAGIGSAEPMLLRDVTGGQPWLVDIQADMLAGLLALRLTQSVGPPLLSGAPVVVLDPHIQAQYVVLQDSTAGAWYVFSAAGELVCAPTAPLMAANVTPPGGPYTWWRWYTLTGTEVAITVTPEGELSASTTPPAGAGFSTPQVLGDAQGHLWHLGVSPDASLGMTDGPPVDYSQAATCLVINDATDARWYWRIDPMTSELVCSAVLEPDVIPWQAQGELGFLTAPDPVTGLDWYCMAASTQEAQVQHAPNLAQPWGMAAEECPMLTTDGVPWRLRVAEDGSIWPLPGAVPDIPYGTPILYAREAAEALRHVEGAGAIMTLWAQ